MKLTEGGLEIMEIEEEVELQSLILSVISDPQANITSPHLQRICDSLNEALTYGSQEQLDSIIKQLPWLTERDARLESGLTWLATIWNHMEFMKIISEQVHAPTDSEEDRTLPLEFEPGVPVLSSPQQIEQLSPDAYIVHLRTKEAATSLIFTRLLSANEFPNLRIIQVTPFVSRYIGPTTRKLLEERPDVELIVSKLEDSKYYLEDPNPPPRTISGIPVLGRAQQIEQLSPDALVVHLSTPDVVTISILKRLLNVSAFPNLRFIQVAPSVATIYIGLTIKEMLEERSDITLIVGRVKDYEHYDIVHPQEFYIEKVAAFEEMKRNFGRNEIYQKMLEFEMDEALLATLYLDGDPNSPRRIADEMGLPYNYVVLKCRIFCCWLGIPSPEKIYGSTKKFLRRFQILEDIASDALLEEEYKKKFNYTGKQPPESLSLVRWEMWHRIMTLFERNPDSFSRISIKNYFALAAYYQLPPYEDQHVLYKDLRKYFEVTTRQGIEWYKNRALAYLGLLDEE